MITRVDFYESTFDRGGYRVPADSGDGLIPTVSVTQDVYPATARYGAEGKGTIRLPIPYAGPGPTLFRSGPWSADVVKITYEECGPIYAFVDSVRPLSMVNGAEVTEVDFTVDPWRTWWGDVEVEEAHFTRVPHTSMFDDVPEQTYPVQYWADVSTKTVLPESYVAWFIMSFMATTSNQPTVVYIPFRKNGTPAGATVDGHDVSDLQTIYTFVQNEFGLQTEQIVFTGWTDWPVVELAEQSTGVYTGTDYHGMGAGTPRTIGSVNTVVWITGAENAMPFMSSTATSTPDVGQRCVLKGYSDEVVDVLPWADLTSFKTALVSKFTTFFIRIVAIEHVIEWQVPVQSLPLGKNALSDYVYSGQKEYEMQTMQLDRDTALVRGMVSSVTGGAQTGAYGMIGANQAAAGATTPAGMAKAGAAMGAAPQMAALSMGAGIVGALADYGVSGWHDDKSIAIKSTYLSKIGGVAMTGQSTYDLYRRRGIVLAVQEPDPDSKSRWDNAILEYGLNDDGWRAPSTTSGWSWAGPYQCDSPRIVRKTASIVPAWGVEHIAGILTRGCYIG